MSTSSVRWKLPSPTWPTIGAISLLSAMSRWVSVTHSASRDSGTQTSVGIMLAPGRSVKVENAALWRASQSLVRSSGRDGPFERPAAEFLGDLAEALGLLGDAALGAVELQEQHRRLAQRELGIEIDRPHLQRVEQLDARDRNAGLDGHDGGVAAGLDRRERTDAAGDRLRNAGELRASAR